MGGKLISSLRIILSMRSISLGGSIIIGICWIRMCWRMLILRRRKIKMIPWIKVGLIGNWRYFKNIAIKTKLKNSRHKKIKVLILLTLLIVSSTWKETNLTKAHSFRSRRKSTKAISTALNQVQHCNNLKINQHRKQSLRIKLSSHLW